MASGYGWEFVVEARGYPASVEAVVTGGSFDAAQSSRDMIAAAPDMLSRLLATEVVLADYAAKLRGMGCPGQADAIGRHLDLNRVAIDAATRWEQQTD